MKITIFVTVVAALILIDASSAQADDFKLGRVVQHWSVPDGSAGCAAGGKYFIGACDEDNVLRLFSVDGSGCPTRLLNLDEHLGFKPKKNGLYRECDLEAAARIGNWIYWIGSH